MHVFSSSRGPARSVVRRVLLTHTRDIVEGIVLSLGDFCAKPFLHVILLVTDSLCLWFGCTHCLAVKQVFPFKNKLVCVASRCDVSLKLNRAGRQCCMEQWQSSHRLSAQLWGMTHRLTSGIWNQQYKCWLHNPVKVQIQLNSFYVELFILVFPKHESFMYLH